CLFPASAGLAVRVVDLLELGIDHARLTRGGSVRTVWSRARRVGGLLGRLDQACCGLRYVFGCLPDATDILALHGIFGRSHRLLKLGAQVARAASLVFPERLLGSVNSRVGLIASLHQLLAPPVLLGMRFGFLDHALDFGLREA